MTTLITLLLSVPFSQTLKPELYLDPGSGSFIIQIAFGFLVGAIVVVKAYWARIRAFFVKESASNPDTPLQKEESDQTNAQ